MAAATRSLAVFEKAVSTAALFLRLRRFSTAEAAAVRRTWSIYYDDTSEVEESAVYQHALKFQRPSTIKQRQVLHNTVSLIGKIDMPLKRINTSNGSFGLHTLLKVSTSSLSRPYFTVLLKMWDEMAEVSIEHLKPNDLVYILGYLGSYMKPDENGKPKMNYEVVVKEINYVTPGVQASSSPETKKKESGGEDEEEKYRNRIHLWQIFLSNPCEWRDFRKSKASYNYPDFKHKDTGEALWLSPGDPPWIKRQLKVLDSRFGYQNL